MAERKTRSAGRHRRTFLDRLRLRRAGFRQEESGQALCLLFLHVLECNPESSLQTPEEA